MAKERYLKDIAADIKKDWKSWRTSAAEPYIRAMSEMYTIHENYYMETGEGIVQYFLSNASTWRGETARNIKSELNNLLTNN